MYSIGIHKLFNQIISIFRVIGYWHRGNGATFRELIVKCLHSLYYPLFVVSLAIGIVQRESTDEKIFLFEIAVEIGVLTIKFIVLIWKQDEIIVLLKQIGLFSVKFHKDVAIFNDRIETFAKFVKVFVVAFFVCLFFEVAVAPFLNKEKALFFQIAFPLDWRRGDLEFWIANCFLCSVVGLSVVPILFSIIVWYMMLISSLRYDILGSELTNMGRTDEGVMAHGSREAWHREFSQDLKSSIYHHIRLKELINEVIGYFSPLFFIQFGTSSLCICGSVYALGFSVGINLVQVAIQCYILFFNISEIFMITYYGNEIMLSSERLQRCLFQSDWMDQPQSTKKRLLIFGECLKRSHQILVVKLYPLTLGTFTVIARSAYSMFNLLQSVKP